MKPTETPINDKPVSCVEGVLSLAKRRIYRFSNNLEAHALMEEIENNYLRTHTINKESYKIILNYLNNFEVTHTALLNTRLLAEIEKINITAEINKRLDYEKLSINKAKSLDKIVFIVGSPRSGTSYLYNLIVYQDHFSYFTNISHHIWPRYNLNNLNGRTHFKELGKGIFYSDTKEMRLKSYMVIPDECEQVFNRAIPVYEPIRRNQYLITPPTIVDASILTDAVSKHLLVFDSNSFICKSPFNSFRIAELAKIFGNKAYFIHIHRNGYAASESIKENGFKYFTPTDSTDDATVFWARHIAEILKNVDQVNMFTISYESLISDVYGKTKSILDWIGVDSKNTKLGTKYSSDHRGISKTQYSNKLVDKYNKLLGYTD